MPAQAPRVLVTRPAREAAQWVRALRAAGLDAQALPLIEIGPAPDPAALAAWLQRLDTLDAVMCVSSNAASGFFGQKQPFPGMDKRWSAIKTRVWATGPGTRDALLAAGVPAARIDMPPEAAGQFDSEALWPCVRPQLAPGAQVLIARGADPTGAIAGRDWLAGRLREAGVQVHQVAAYSRRPPAWGAAQRAQAAQALAAPSDGAAGGVWWHLSSSEAVANLRALLPGQGLSAARAVCTHPRIAQAAREAGFGTVAEVGAGLYALSGFLQSPA